MFADTLLGRALSFLQQNSEAHSAVKASRKLCKEGAGRSTFMARVNNLLGHIYLNMGEYMESLDYHLNAYEMLVGKTESDFHLDVPTYLMNIGTGVLIYVHDQLSAKIILGSVSLEHIVQQYTYTYMYRHEI